MIRVVMLGRLGNNLFQYALGRVLAERHQVPLVMDASWFNGEGWRQVSVIRRLGIRATVVRRFSLPARALLKVSGKHYWEFRGVPVRREKTTDQSFDPAMLAAPADCVLMGYFQTPLYFQSMEDEIRGELDLGAACAGANIPPDLFADHSVAVHVRRTDFTSIPIFGVCGMDYYRAAMDRLRQRHPGARFFIFSDDPAWCREHFRGSGEEVMNCNRDPLHDLHLMSLARHHVTANSTYSWWAAWLGKKEGQQVLCPSRWYKNGDIVAPIAEKLCPGWETVEVGPS